MPRTDVIRRARHTANGTSGRATARDRRARSGGEREDRERDHDDLHPKRCTDTVHQILRHLQEVILYTRKLLTYVLAITNNSRMVSMDPFFAQSHDAIGRKATTAFQINNPFDP
jgi:hypothetical protein